MPNSQFQPDTTYQNVFLIFVDAAGHSGIVANTPLDRAGEGFNLLQRKVMERLEAAARRHRCDRAQPWRWAGDGGFLVVHDDDESVAKDTALDFARNLIDVDLPYLRDEFRLSGIDRGLHLRIAIHRGTIRYLGEGLVGSIISSDINFVAHLEKATPSDTVAVSEDVYRVAGRFAELFERVGELERHVVYLYPGAERSGSAARVWLRARGLAGGVPVHGYPERPSQQEKSRLIQAATQEVVHLGASLRTTARLLMPTERPAYYRDAVLDFLKRDGRYRCVCLDPESPAVEMLSLQRDEDISSKIEESLRTFRRFKERYGVEADGLEVYHTPTNLGMSCLGIDLQLPHAMLLTSPYLQPPPSLAPALDLGDLPHYLLSAANGPLFGKSLDLVRALATEGVRRVL